MLKGLRALLGPAPNAANAVDFAAARYPDLPIFHLDAPLPYRGLGDGPITPRMLLAFINRVGNILLDAGMKRYDRVAIWKTNAPDYYFIACAIIKAGGIAVPINGGMALDDLRYYLGHTGAKLLVTDAQTVAERIKSPAALPMVQTWIFPKAPAAFGAPHVNLDALLETASAELRPAKLTRDSDIMIVHTSGTTGFPKGVLTSTSSILAGIRLQRAVAPLSRGARVVVVTPFNHVVTHLGLFTCLLLEMPVWLVSNFKAKDVLALIARTNASIFAGFPDKYLALYEEGLDTHDLSSMRLWVNLADAAHDVHMRAFCRQGTMLRIFGRRVVRGSVFMDTLGSSELGGPALTRFIFPFSRSDLSRNVGRTSIFGPRMKIADEDGRSVPRGTVGRFMVKGPTLFKGYWNAHEKLHGTVHDGWWWTGDLGYRDRAGRYHHVDRQPDVIHTQHGPVYSLLIEEVCMAHPDVSEAAVIGLRHPERGEVPVAVVYPRTGHAIDPAACRAWVNERVTRCSMGLETVLVVTPADIPRGLTGKVLKRVLRERHAELFAASTSDALTATSP
jgi:acyl-coenzyme A synthetase/AMP-(fatty) acid ligase